MSFISVSLLFMMFTFDLIHLATQESAFILEKDNFKWQTGGWAKCTPQGGPGGGNCTQFRSVQCRNGVNQRAPPSFCRPEDRPVDTRACTGPCPEDCLISSWSEWTECSATCAPTATKVRKREVLRSEVNRGRPCGDLSELVVCDDLPECGEMMTPLHTWRTGEWTSCRKVETIDIPCGLGQKTRSVTCIDESGRDVPEDGCLQRNRGNSPLDLEICSVPCDCELSDWTWWSPCSQICLDTEDPTNVGSETRSREILRLPDRDGLPCAHLTEQRECDTSNITLAECPVYEWITQDWQDCEPTDDICGGGKEWRQVFCVKTGDITLQPVDEKHCVLNDEKKPASRRACWRECPVDCQLGEWENWSACSKSCGEGGIHLRQREVLAEPAHGGTPCDALYQAKECEPVECAWWRTGAWSTCFLNNVDATCGDGSWYRVMYCISALDQEVDDSNCDPDLRPLSQDDCTVPCPQDCIISEWSKWSPCSVSCGKQGGVQTRWREILAHGSDSDPCISDSELTQTTVCNLHVSCDTYIWQISPWEECTIIDEGVEETCGEDVGMQKRNITCEIDSGIAANETLCLASQKPESHQPCSIPCQVDCVVSEWSDWSDCNQTCGLEAHRERSKVVLVLDANGGIPCPNGTNEERVLYESMPCEGVPPCYSYQWHAGNWSQCLVARDLCGQGLREREVSCQRNDGETVDPGFCVREVFGSIPLSHEQCYIPCGGDCELTEWTPYGPCQPDCGTTRYTGYCRQRSKKLVVDHPEDTLTLCPDLTPNDLLEIIPCTDQEYNYTTAIGTWGQCIVDGPCGGGIRERPTACIREDSRMVPHTFCLSEPPATEECTVECPHDCVVSDWLNWSPCSARCGTGLKTRQRVVEAPSQGLGKECPHLAESMPCHLATCDSFVWVIGDWSPCYLTNRSVNCGSGMRNRSVECPAGEEFGADCARRRPKPPMVTPCELPCPGDCVVGEWSEFSPCSLDCVTVSRRNRSRTVIRPPAAEGGKPCEEVYEEADCDNEVCRLTGYHNKTTDWTQCKPHHGDCGPGIQWQVSTCIDEVTSLSVTVDRCNQSNEVAEQGCFVPCPIDCEYEEFSDWSVCSQECGQEGTQSRSRKVLTSAKHGGRICSDGINQTRPCNIKPCFSYEWLREPWSDCLFDDSFTGCGVGVETRRVECIRSDGLSVALEFCVLPEELALLQANNVVHGFNMSAMDIVTSRTCDRPCPGDCVLSEWSGFSPCLASCFDSSLPGKQTRSRHIVAYPSPDGLQCPDAVVETKLCSNPSCPEFKWKSGPWDGTEIPEREVWCEMEGSSLSNVTGGCLEAVRPPSSVLCRSPLCAEYGSACQTGICQCTDDYQGNGVACYPTDVCRDDAECSEILPESYCAKGGVCRCLKQYDLRDGTCRVPYARTETDKTWVWFVIAGCCVAAVIILLCAIFIVSRGEKGGFQPLDQNNQHPLEGDENDPEMIRMSMLDGDMDED